MFHSYNYLCYTKIKNQNVNYDIVCCKSCYKIFLPLNNEFLNRPKTFQKSRSSSWWYSPCSVLLMLEDTAIQRGEWWLQEPLQLSNVFCRGPKLFENEVLTRQSEIGKYLKLFSLIWSPNFIFSKVLNLF